MSLLRSLIFLACATMVAATEPKAVAEAAMQAWNRHDAEALLPLMHRDLLSRMRQARAISFYLQSHPEKRGIPQTGSDAEVVALLCEALREIVPAPDEKLRTETRFVESHEFGDLVFVTFETSLVPIDGSAAAAPPKPVTYILKRQDDRLLFLWSPPVALHVDLQWDPRQ